MPAGVPPLGIANTVNERLEEARPLTTKDWNEIKAELAKRDAQIKSLEEKLAAANTSRASADKTLEDKITANATARSSVDKALENKIDANAIADKKLEEKLMERTSASVTSVNSDGDVTGAMGGKEAVAMLNDLYETGDFRGGGKDKYGLSAQMVRMMLIFYRMIKRLIKVNNLKWT